jgi:hypothetical protein
MDFLFWHVFYVKAKTPTWRLNRQVGVWSRMLRSDADESEIPTSFFFSSVGVVQIRIAKRTSSAIKNILNVHASQLLLDDAGEVNEMFPVRGH